MKTAELIPEYLRHLRTAGRSYYTIRASKYALRDFAKYLEEENAAGLEDLTSEVTEGFRQDLAFRLTAKGTLLTLQTQSQILSAVRGFTRFLKEGDHIFRDPGAKIRMPKQPKSLPKVILSTDEVRRLLSAPDMRTDRGVRNRVIIEILYDTAIRRSELSSIRLGDPDLETGYIHIRGKGDRERVVPLSPRVCGLVRDYILMVRPSFVRGEDEGWLVMNRWGKRMNPNGVWAVVKRCVTLAGISRTVSTHTLRHTCATHMLRNGAPVRHVQELLGHESLTSTQVYTRVTINDLREIHAKYHPGEMMENRHSE